MCLCVHSYKFTNELNAQISFSTETYARARAPAHDCTRENTQGVHVCIQGVLLCNLDVNIQNFKDIMSLNGSFQIHTIRTMVKM